MEKRIKSLKPQSRDLPRRSKLVCHTSELQDVPDLKKKRKRTQSQEIPLELIHRIQSFLPVGEDIGTCILSKSWLHAWSTIPTLRIPPQPRDPEQERNYKKWIDRTLLRYKQDNIPIETFDLNFTIMNQKSASLVKKWIYNVASKTCLKEISLSIWVGIDSFTLPDAILFSCVNLKTLNVENRNGSPGDEMLINSLWIRSNTTLINCVSLRVLNFQGVTIREEVLENLFSTCKLLEKVNLYECKGFKTTKVKNLRCLRELKIGSIEEEDRLEIDDVPSLCLFHYNLSFSYSKKPLPFNMDSLGSVTQLDIGGVIMDATFFEVIKSKFPLLDCLTLDIEYAEPKSLIITSASLKRLTLIMWIKRKIDVQVYAPNLLCFIYEGCKPKPMLSLPTIPSGKVEIIFTFK